MIEQSCMNESSSLYVKTLPNLVAVDILVVEISQDHVTKGLCDFMSKSKSRLVTNLPSLVAMGIEVVEI